MIHQNTTTASLSKKTYKTNYIIRCENHGIITGITLLLLRYLGYDIGSKTYISPHFVHKRSSKRWQLDSRRQCQLQTNAVKQAARSSSKLNIHIVLAYGILWHQFYAKIGKIHLFCNPFQKAYFKVLISVSPILMLLPLHITNRNPVTTDQCIRYRCQSLECPHSLHVRWDIRKLSHRYSHSSLKFKFHHLPPLHIMNRNPLTVQYMRYRCQSSHCPHSPESGTSVTLRVMVH